MTIWSVYFTEILPVMNIKVVCSFAYVVLLVSLAGFWKSSFKNSLLAPYLSSSLPPLSPGSHSTTLSPTFPGLYPPSSLSSQWGRNSASPPPLHSVPFHLRSNECERCGRLYKTRKGLKHHIKNECGVEPRFQCTRCDWKFKQKAHLLRHMARKHSPPT